MPGLAGNADDASGAGIDGRAHRVMVSGEARLMGQPALQPAQDVRDWPGMAMARSAMMFFWISVDPPPMVL